MTKQPEWAEVLRAIEAEGAVEMALTAWMIGVSVEATAETLELYMLGAAELDGPNGRQFLLAVPARINELARTLGDTYWQTLAKAPPKIAVSKTGTHRIRDVRHQVILIDVAAWRAWAAEHRDPSSLTNEELKGFVDRVLDLNERKREIAEDIKDVYAEAKATGYDTKVMRKVVAILESDDKRPGWQEFTGLIDLYLDHLGGDDEA